MNCKRLCALFFKRKIRCVILLLVLLYMITTFTPRLLFSEQNNVYKRDLMLSQKILHLEYVRRSTKESTLNRFAQDPNFRQFISRPQVDNITVLETSKARPRRFIFAFRHYEQLGRATENLLDLCSLAAYGHREVVAPYVNNSRMSGLPYGVGHHFRKNRKKNFGPFDNYFDFNEVNNKLKSNGYATLALFSEMARSCNHRLNIVVHFLYPERQSIADTVSWYQIRQKDIRGIYLRARQNNGWTNCPQIRKSDLAKQLGGFKINRYLCVDPEIIRSLEQFEDEILQGANCVGIVQWKGGGPGRTHFPLASAINTKLYPSDLKHNIQLLNIAQTFVKTSGLGKPFISVHVRAERHIFRRGENVTRHCFRKLASRVEKLRIKHDWNVYLASDLVDHGSDTLSQDVGKKQRLALYEDLKRILKYPFTLSPIKGLYDTGSMAIIEMHILSSGRKLVTLGGGNYQEWIVKLFSQNVRDTSHSLHRVCELR